MTASALLFTTDEALRENVASAISAISGCRLQCAETLDGAKSIVRTDRPAVLLVHLASQVDEAAVIELIEHCASGKIQVATVIISDKYDAAQAIKLLRLGVADYLSRPLDLSRISLLTDILTWRVRHMDPHATAAADDAVMNLGDDGSFLYRSAEMTTIVEQIRRVAPLETTLLLTGETGTGKTRLARLIHEMSPRSCHPFAVVNCGSLSPSLVESELFGHVKGAFTGAERDRDGKFTHAGAGTLMLDEIDSLPITVQAKLLRAVDERMFEPLGSNRTLPLNARLIVATNRNLKTEVDEGRFRSDLYYRVDVVSFCLPPLRQRQQLIEPLIQNCVIEFSRRHGRTPPSVSPEAISAMKDYKWPGNVRELRNVLERSVALCRDDQIQIDDLPDELRRGKPDSLPEVVDRMSMSRWLQAKVEAEATAIVAALSNNGNNRSRTARELGISRVTLYKRLHKYGLI